MAILRIHRITFYKVAGSSLFRITVNSLIKTPVLLYDKPLGGASRLWGTFPPLRGFLRDENRTIIS